MTKSEASTLPYRQIRAAYDADTITVYQAYSEAIALPAVRAQKLNAAPEFKHGRMTWIKPSWAWMMYRAGYSFKDKGQARILAIKMKHEHFLGLLEKGILSNHAPSGDASIAKGDEQKANVRIQWDPERTAKLEVLPYRSIQIGISGVLSTQWVAEWMESIEDVTDTAKELKKVLDEDPDISMETLLARGLIPHEEPYTVPDHIIQRLEMTPV